MDEIILDLMEDLEFENLPPESLDEFARFIISLPESHERQSMQRILDYTIEEETKS